LGLGREKTSQQLCDPGPQPMDDPDVGGIRRAVDLVVKRERVTGLLEVDGVDQLRRVKCSPSPVAVVERVTGLAS